ncbi:hypothetical protein Salat_1704400 [Sesamum alatum]|uniref:Uncharacterized protein n=1 Tax=Sesamum alatum TaxID=300844 RepID=A0AAE2CK44_9LAMI|nr:hypothetical protein Salat_1704400 [Sesamum alatum]
MPRARASAARHVCRARVRLPARAALCRPRTVCCLGAQHPAHVRNILAVVRNDPHSVRSACAASLPAPAIVMHHSTTLGRTRPLPRLACRLVCQAKPVCPHLPKSADQLEDAGRKSTKPVRDICPKGATKGHLQGR